MIFHLSGPQEPQAFTHLGFYILGCFCCCYHTASVDVESRLQQCSESSSMPVDKQELTDGLWHLRQARDQINDVKDLLVREAPKSAQEAICSMWGARVRTGTSRAVRFDNPCCRGYQIVQPCSCLLSPCNLPCFIGTITYAMVCETKSAPANRVLQIPISSICFVHWFNLICAFSLYDLWLG